MWAFLPWEWCTLMMLLMDIALLYTWNMWWRSFPILQKQLSYSTKKQISYSAKSIHKYSLHRTHTWLISFYYLPERIDAVNSYKMSIKYCYISILPSKYIFRISCSWHVCCMYHSSCSSKSQHMCTACISIKYMHKRLILQTYVMHHLLFPCITAWFKRLRNCLRN